MESEVAKQALDLFDECTKILNGEFRDHEIFWLANQRHEVIVGRLEKMGFTVKKEQHSSKKKTTLLRGELEIEEISYTLRLLPNSSQDGSHLSISHPTSKIYTGTLPLPKKSQLTTEISKDDAEWLQENHLRLGDTPKIKTNSPEKWHFTLDQRHALLVALEKHWNQLGINAKEVGIFIGQRDTWKRIIEQAIEIWPNSDGSDRYVLCFLIECELKYLKVVREIVRKYGGTVLNVCSSPDCSSDKHIGYIEALENWLDENLNRVS